MRRAPGTERRRGYLVATVLALLLQLWALYLYAPSPGGPAIFPHADKVVHAVIFGLPVVLAHRAGLAWPGVAVLLAVHAPLSEMIQLALLPDRSGDGADVLADLVGICLAVALISLTSSPDSRVPRVRVPGDDAG